MLTKWEYSDRTEAERLIHCAHNMAIGFYKTNNFIVLPGLSPAKNANIVTFPNLEYHKIRRFWEKVKRVDVRDFPLVIDSKFVSQVSELLKSAGLKQPNFSKAQGLWQKAEKVVINEIEKVLPSKKGAINKITIYPTIFGTGASFNAITKNGEVILYLREDKGIHTITEAIITSLTRVDIYKKLEGLWSESEIITDFLVTQSSIGKVLNKYESIDNYIATIKGVRVKEQAKLISLSDEFYKKIGVPLVNTDLFSKPLDNLNMQENRVLKALLKNSNRVLTIDEIGELMFANENDFSLYAITKLIQRLRTKLEQNGISGSYIQTLRGKGYLLKN